MTSWAVARDLARSTYDAARDLASESPTDASPGFDAVPALTNPLASAW